MNKSRSGFLLSVGLLFASMVILATIWVFSPVHRSSAQTSQASNTKLTGPRQSALVSEYLSGMKKLRGGGLTSAQRKRLASQMADVRQRLKDLRTQMRVSSGALPFGPPPKGSEEMTANAAPNAKSVGRCQACKYILNQTIEDIGGKISNQIFQASFEQNCGNAFKDQISAAVCEDLYDDFYALTDDYMSNSWDPTKLCQMASQCP